MAYNQSKRFYLFNSDKTYNLEIVKKFLLEVKEKYDLKISVDCLYFGQQRMADVCETTLPNLVMDFAVFVVHANESRLSINEDNAGIGYARIYRALLQKTDNKVLIVIGGDSYYADEGEEARFVISRWARRKVQSQFSEEYLDGRQSFIFSWNEKHRPIHEDALRHFLDARKRGSKFDYTPPEPKAIEPAVAQPLPKPVAPTASKPLLKPIAPMVAQPLPKHRPPVVRQSDSAATSDVRQKPFLMERDSDFLFPDEGRTSGTRSHKSFNDRESQTTDLRHDLHKDTYGAIRANDGRKSAGDQAETVLLETKVFFGVISYNDEDISQNKDGWRPSARQESAVWEDLKSFRLREVKFYRTGNDPAVIYTYDPTPSARKECCSSFYEACCSCIGECLDCLITCFVWLALCLGFLWGWCRDKCRGR